MATTLMKQTIRNKGVASVAELRQACIEGGVNLIGCQMTVDLFGFSHGDFIPEVKEYCGAATFLPMARDADVSLFI
jgi:peroxiredoxin family protein